MRRPADRPSAKNLLAELAAKDQAEAKHKSLFFVPGPQRLPTLEPSECPTDSGPQPPSAPGPVLAVAPPTEEELGITWTDKLKKLMETHRVVLVIDDEPVKLIPMDDAAFALAAKALQTMAVKTPS